VPSWWSSQDRSGSLSEPSHWQELSYLTEPTSHAGYLNAGPVATVDLPRGVPSGFHGPWLPDTNTDTDTDTDTDRS
jgi:hypothetical protein